MGYDRVFKTQKMRLMNRMKLVVYSLILVLSCCSSQKSYGQGQVSGKNILVFTKNGEGFKHDNIEASSQAIVRLGEESGFKVTVSEDSKIFNPEELRRYTMVVFANTNNEVFEQDVERLAFRQFVQAGGTVLGIHSVLGTERNWKWFSQLVGGTFVWHPRKQNLRVIKIKEHSSVEGLPTFWELEDECYFTKSFYPGIENVLAVDLNRLTKEAKDQLPNYISSFGMLHPVTWHQAYDGGHVWVTSLGHNKEIYQDATFLKHLKQGIQYLLTRYKGLDYEKVSVRHFDEGLMYE